MKFDYALSENDCAFNSVIKLHKTLIPTKNSSDQSMLSATPSGCFITTLLSLQDFQTEHLYLCFVADGGRHPLVCRARREPHQRLRIQYRQLQTLSQRGRVPHASGGGEVYGAGKGGSCVLAEPKEGSFTTCCNQNQLNVFQIHTRTRRLHCEMFNVPIL